MATTLLKNIILEKFSKFSLNHTFTVSSTDFTRPRAISTKPLIEITNSILKRQLVLVNEVGGGRGLYTVGMILPKGKLSTAKIKFQNPKI